MEKISSFKTVRVPIKKDETISEKGAQNDPLSPWIELTVPSGLKQNYFNRIFFE